ncbi:hypothetical protein D6821_00255, partial [Candidatus Parcubacteria bacterium]
MDGVGKTTQCALLKEWLEDQGHQVIISKELESSSFGRIAKRILMKGVMGNCRLAEMFLFLAVKSFHFSTIVKPAIVRGVIVLGDRGHGSFLNYHWPLIKDWDKLWTLVDIATRGIHPLQVFVLDVSVEEVKRRLFLKEEKSRFDIQSFINLTEQKERYRQLAKHFGWFILDANYS